MCLGEQNFKFQLGVGDVVKGWDQGLVSRARSASGVARLPCWVAFLIRIVKDMRTKWTQGCTIIGRDTLSLLVCMCCQVGMREGGTRTLIVPPKLGYGKKGSGKDIPPDSTLRFVITLKRLELEG